MFFSLFFSLSESLCHRVSEQLAVAWTIRQQGFPPDGSVMDESCVWSLHDDTHLSLSSPRLSITAPFCILLLTPVSSPPSLSPLSNPFFSYSFVLVLLSSFGPFCNHLFLFVFSHVLSILSSLSLLSCPEDWSGVWSQGQWFVLCVVSVPGDAVHGKCGVFMLITACILTTCPGNEAVMTPSVIRTNTHIIQELCIPNTLFSHLSTGHPVPSGADD